MSGDKIEIPSIELLNRHRDVVNVLWKISHATRLEPGWHFLLDLTWIAENPGPVSGKSMDEVGFRISSKGFWSRRV
jgi:hypothetical protein